MTASLSEIVKVLLVGGVVGFCIWLILEKIPMTDTWKKVLQVIAIVLFILFVLQYLLPKL